MRIGRILYPIRELGPGERLGIWVQGCDRRCPGCANPELWVHDEKKDIPLPIVTELVKSVLAASKLDGITITGGEPILQAKQLSELLSAVKPLCGDILLFTGFRYNDLLFKNDPDINALLSYVSVLVDGEYIMELNDGDRLRGSRNQRVLFLEKEKEDSYLRYMRADQRYIDSFVTDQGIISVGIHPQRFLDEVRDPGEENSLRI